MTPCKHLRLKLQNSLFWVFAGVFSVDTGRKLKVQKTFRRRLGRLLNVLCTFNLRPVSTGLDTFLHQLPHFLTNFWCWMHVSTLHKK